MIWPTSHGEKNADLESLSDKSQVPNSINGKSSPGTQVSWLPIATSFSPFYIVLWTLPQKTAEIFKSLTNIRRRKRANEWENVSLQAKDTLTKDKYSRVFQNVLFTQMCYLMAAWQLSHASCPFQWPHCLSPLSMPPVLWICLPLDIESLRIVFGSSTSWTCTWRPYTSLWLWPSGHKSLVILYT